MHNKQDQTQEHHKKKIRLQKVLAHSGVASRRKAEILILEGAVSVNGACITQLGTLVDPAHDKIKVHGKLIFTDIERTYLALYKPKGILSTLHDSHGRPTLLQCLKGVRTVVMPIGGLDFNTEGLVLLTNDGNLANKISKQQGLLQTFRVKVKGRPKFSDLEFLKRGLFTRDGVIRFQSYMIANLLKHKTWLELRIVEGAHLNFREILNRKGLMVDRIIRTSIGGISIHRLGVGQYKLLRRKDFEALVHSKLLA